MTDVDTRNEKRKRSQHIVRSTAMLMVLFTIAKGISLVQTVIIARYLGVGSEWDAFVTANRIPELIVILISGGALGHAFIPIFSGYLARGETIDGYKLASHVVNLIFTVALVASGIVFLLTPLLVRHVLAPGFDDATTLETIRMMRLLLVGSILFAISGIFSGVLHSHNHFLLPAVAPIVFDLGILFGVVFLLKPFGVFGVAMGTVLGAACHMSIQIPGLLRYGAMWFPELDLRDPALWRVIRLMIPRVGGLFVFQFNFIVSNNIASRLGEGAVSAWDWGWKLMQIPETLIGTAMGIVIFPTLAALSEVQDEVGKRSAMSGALRFIVIATIPSAVGLILVGQPLLRLLERGAFDSSATTLVYGTLRAFTLGLIVHSMLEIVARSFYADKDTLTPLWAAIGGALVNLVLAFTLSGIAFGSKEVSNVSGLAMANSLGVVFELVVLYVLLRRRWNGIDEGTLVATIVKTVAASLIMGIGLIVIEAAFNMAGLTDRFIYTVGLVVSQVVAGGIIFFTASLLLGMQEIRDVFGIVFRRHKLNVDAVHPAP